MTPGDVRAWLEGPSFEVAPRLLGWRLVHESGGARVAVVLTEVEAYDGAADRASHAYRGRSRRNAVMFGGPGRLYVYFSYGMHWCVNVVCRGEGQASAVLLRAGRVVEGIDVARLRRGARVTDRRLASGPACLSQALAITGANDGADLLGNGSLRLEEPGTPAATFRIESGPRVGIAQAAEIPWRFWIEADETVSAYKRSTRAPSPTHE